MNLTAPSAPSERAYRRGRRLLGVGLGLLLGTVALEIAALVLVALAEGALFHRLPVEARDRASVGAATGAREPFARTAAVHPFWSGARAAGCPVIGRDRDARLDRMILGPGKRPPWTRATTNNCGFVAREDYPLAREHASEFFVGVLGGSVASFLALIGEPTLVAVLGEDRRLAGRRIRIVNLAKPGGKQPQQLGILSYFTMVGQPLDVVVNVDGFNEAALSLHNHAQGVDISFPRGYPGGFPQFLRKPTAAAIDWQADVLAHRRHVARFAAWEDQRVSAGLHLVGRLLRRRARRTLEARISHPPEAPSAARRLFAAADLDDALDHERLPAAIADQWMRASLAMKGVAHAASAHYVHVLQPNQYFTDRHFDAEEAQIALAPGHPYEAGVRAVYPEMLARAPELVRRGVHFVDALGVFDDEPRRVYADACCHFTDLGNEILAREVARAILATLPQGAGGARGDR